MARANAKPYLKAIESYEKEFEKWEKRSDKIVKRYRDERDTVETGAQKFNIFWSNIEILSSVLYGNLPKPQVERRFKDADPTARLASTVIERACGALLMNGIEPIHDGRSELASRMLTLRSDSRFRATGTGYLVCRRWSTGRFAASASG